MAMLYRIPHYSEAHYNEVELYYEILTKNASEIF